MYLQEALMSDMMFISHYLEIQLTLLSCNYLYKHTTHVAFGIAPKTRAWFCHMFHDSTAALHC